MSRHFWTEQDKTRLKELNDAGLTIEEIAQRMGLRYCQVLQAKTKAGIHCLKRWANWTEERKATLRELTEKGLSCSQIAEVLGLNPVQVKSGRAMFKIRAPRPAIPDGMKRCPRCKTLKPVADFYKSKREKDGRRAYCKDCTNSFRPRKPRIQVPEGMKHCYRCSIDKPVAEFCRCRRSKDGLQAYCKDCQKSYRESLTIRSLALAR